MYEDLRQWLDDAFASHARLRAFVYTPPRDVVMLAANLQRTDSRSPGNAKSTESSDTEPSSAASRTRDN
jgi:hypothetical protein